MSQDLKKITLRTLEFISEYLCYAKCYSIVIGSGTSWVSETRAGRDQRGKPLPSWQVAVLISKEKLHVRLVLGGSKTNGSLNPPAKP